MILHRLFFFIFFVSTVCAMDNATISHDSFKEFNEKCIILPTYRYLYLFAQDNFSSTEEGFVLSKDGHKKHRLISEDQFEDMLDRYLDATQTTLPNKNLWIADSYVESELHKRFIFKHQCIQYLPYAQKIILNQDDIVLFRGDMHGDIHSMMSFLRQMQAEKYTDDQDGFCIINPHVKLIFLGDYVDRGIYGAEVIYTILRLKIANPDQVILVRGNHEEYNMNKTQGFAYELKHKFSEDNMLSILQRLNIVYESMPVVCYVGKKVDEEQFEYLQCCHGGMEIGYNPQALLESEKSYEFLGNLKRKSEHAQLGEQPYKSIASMSYRALGDICSSDLVALENGFASHVPYQNQFMWGDFHVSPDEILGIPLSSARLRYDKSMTNAVLMRASSQMHKVCAVIRGHQHVPRNRDALMQRMLQNNGVAQHWIEEQCCSKDFSLMHGGVCTLLLSPDSSSGMAGYAFTGFEFHTILKLTPEGKFEDWKFEAQVIDLYKELNKLKEGYDHY